MQRDGGEVTIQIQLSGFNTSDDDVEHGFHVHEFGTISDATGCSSTGAHYNPESKNHGAPTATERYSRFNIMFTSQNREGTRSTIKGPHLTFSVY